MLPAEARLAGVRRLFEEQAYFTVHAPRQAGKTTSVRALAESLTAEGRYAALWASCEQGEAAGGELFAQHTAETGQPFSADAISRAHALTGGQPWLVNTLARQVVQEELTERSHTVDVPHVDAAKEALVLRRDTHLDSLIARLREPRLRRVIEPILAGKPLPRDVEDNDILDLEELGVIPPAPARFQVTNPIIRALIARQLDL
jgi:hypothetical protein